jgi:hypothetical protein
MKSTKKANKAAKAPKKRQPKLRTSAQQAAHEPVTITGPFVGGIDGLSDGQAAEYFARIEMGRDPEDDNFWDDY